MNKKELKEKIKIQNDKIQVFQYSDYFQCPLCGCFENYTGYKPEMEDLDHSKDCLYLLIKKLK